MNDRQRRRNESGSRWRSLMIDAQAGDGASYEKLLGELLPQIRIEVARRVGDPAERDDIVQTVLISIHRSRHTYRPESPFLPWLRAVVRNAAIDWMRARGRRARYESGRDVETLTEPSYEAKLPGDEALSPELEGALASLPDRQREAVELLHLEGLSVAEAAERAGASPGALKVRAHRGYRALRALLGRDEP